MSDVADFWKKGVTKEPVVSDALDTSDVSSYWKKPTANPVQTAKQEPAKPLSILEQRRAATGTSAERTTVKTITRYEGRDLETKTILPDLGWLLQQIDSDKVQEALDEIQRQAMGGTLEWPSTFMTPGAPSRAQVLNTQLNRAIDFEVKKLLLKKLDGDNDPKIEKDIEVLRMIQPKETELLPPAMRFIGNAIWGIGEASADKFRSAAAVIPKMLAWPFKTYIGAVIPQFRDTMDEKSAKLSEALLPTANMQEVVDRVNDRSPATLLSSLMLLNQDATRAGVFGELLDIRDADGNQINIDVARKTANAVGAMNQVVDTAMNVVGFVTPGITAIGGKSWNAAVRAFASGGGGATLAKGMLGRLGSLAVEQGSGAIIQASAPILGVEFAKNANNNAYGTEFEGKPVLDLLAQIGINAIPQAAMGIAMGAVGSGKELLTSRINFKPDLPFDTTIFEKKVADAYTEMTGQKVILEDAPPPMKPPDDIPDTGQYCAVKIDDGTVYIGKDGETHFEIIRDKNIPDERITSGGYVNNGTYDSGGTTIMDFVEKRRAKKAALAVARERSNMASKNPKTIDNTRKISEFMEFDESTEGYKLIPESDIEETRIKLEEKISIAEEEFEAYKGKSEQKRKALANALATAKEEARLTARTIKAENRTKLKVKKLIQDIEGIDTKEMNPEYKKPIDDILDAINTRKISDKKVERLAEIEQMMRDNPEIDLDEADFELLNRASRKQVSEMTVEELQAIRDDLKYFEKVAKTQGKIFLRGKAEDVETAIGSMLGEIEDTPPSGTKRARPTTRDRLNQVGHAVKEFATIDLEQHDLTLNKIFGGGEETNGYQYLAKSWNDRGNVKLGVKQSAETKLQSWWKEIGIKESVEKYYGRKTGVYTDIINNRPVELSMADELAIYMDSRLPDNWESRKNGFSFEDSPNDLMKLSEADLDTIVKKVKNDPTAMRLVAMADDVIKDLKEPLRQKQIEVKNFANEMIEENYWKMKKAPIGLSRKEMKDMAMDVQRGQLRLGADERNLRARTGSTAPIVHKDFATNLNEIIDYASNYIAYADLVPQTRKILEDSRMWTKIRNKWGDGAYERIVKGYKDIIGQTNSGISNVQKGFQKLRGHISSAILSLKFDQYFKQWTSVARYNVYVPNKYILKGMFYELMNHKEARMILKDLSPTYWDRVTSGYSKEASEVFLREAMGRMSGSRKLLGKLYWGQAGDTKCVTEGMWGAIFQAQDEIASVIAGKGTLSRQVMNATGLTDEMCKTLSPIEISEKSVRYAEWATLRTQNTTWPQYESNLARNKDIISEAITFMGSEKSTVLNMLKRTALENKNKSVPNTTKVRKMSSAVVTGLIYPAIVGVISKTIADAAQNKEDKNPSIVGKLAEGIISETTGMFPILRDIANGVIGQVKYGAFAGNTSNLFIDQFGDTATKMVSDIAIAIKDGIETKKTFTSKQTKLVLDAVDKLGQLVLSWGLGIPYVPAKKQITGAARLLGVKEE